MESITHGQAVAGTRGAKNVRLPVEVAEGLASRAESLGLTLPRYMHLLSGRFDDVDLLVLEAMRAAVSEQIAERRARVKRGASAGPVVASAAASAGSDERPRAASAEPSSQRAGGPPQGGSAVGSVAPSAARASADPQRRTAATGSRSA